MISLYGMWSGRNSLSRTQMAAMLLSGAPAVLCAKQGAQLRNSTVAKAPCTPAFVARQKAGSLSSLKTNSLKRGGCPTQSL